MSTWKNNFLMDSTSFLMEQLSFFHDHALLILSLITCLVGYLMMSLMLNKFNYRYLLEGQLIELIWTILPALTLIFIALPSLKLIYMIEEIRNPLMTLKTIGHQWYWTYEYSDFKNIEFDSYMIPVNDMKSFNFRLLEVDNHTIIPYNTPIRLLSTSSDVIHSWTIPSSGVKMDASPGRLNQMMLNFNRTGIFFGQCSEICGSNHSFMPIMIESISHKNFITWLKSFK
uniref:Cytochrome c oxidase subunit 2 n=1 Tax=Nephus voeltzkowi TaxID=2233631 RepID=A0A6M3WFP6_9CUCU|nr:cytochrome c oxidase subunit 2 [Nephus voeltzkowi]QJF72901.1 cytochrome c oxidase subunit 2 [Nephus voeltzkowi]QJF72914.1 cytochrome c oxidase subunit 2 [Nephus voeltzkowi]QJF72927.1 cytochrome c oxidase subunit 2 [Nephus voeltzkowi]